MLRPKELERTLKTIIELNQPVYIEGGAGIGKSEIITKVGKSLGYNVVDVRVSLLDPVDLRGVPSVEDGVTKWNPPVFLPREEDGKSILFLDELVHGSPSVQKALFQLIKDRKIGEYTMPKDTVIIGAGNRVADRAGANQMNSALANRFINLELEVNENDWYEWAITEGNIDPNVIAFIRYRPELLYDFPEDKNEKAWASPRTWEFVSNIIKAKPEQGRIEEELIKGTVGEGAGIEFVGFMKTSRELPDIKEILKKPKTYPIGDNPAINYAITGALANRATASNLGNIITFVTREEMSQEFAVITMRDISMLYPQLTKTKEYIKFAQDFKDLLS